MTKYMNIWMSTLYIKWHQSCVQCCLSVFSALPTQCSTHLHNIILYSWTTCKITFIIRSSHLSHVQFNIECLKLNHPIETNDHFISFKVGLTPKYTRNILEIVEIFPMQMDPFQREQLAFWTKQTRWVT